MGKIKNFSKLISVALIVAILWVTTLGSSVMAGPINNGIEVSLNDSAIDLWNKPFFDNEEIFLPLRETLNNCGISDNNIKYNKENGKIDITFYSDLVPQMPIIAHIFTWEQGVRFDLDADNNKIQNYSNGKRTTSHPVVNRDGVTYAPLGVFVRIKDFSIKNDILGKTDKNLRTTCLRLLDNLTVKKYADNGKYNVALGKYVTINSDNPNAYYSEGENVIIGTAQEQNKFVQNHKEINNYYFAIDTVKRILTDDEGKVLAVIPVENQRHEMLDRCDGEMLVGTSRGWESILNEYISIVDDAKGQLKSGIELCLWSTDSGNGRMVPQFWLPLNLQR